MKYRALLTLGLILFGCSSGKGGGGSAGSGGNAAAGHDGGAGAGGASGASGGSGGSGGRGGTAGGGGGASGGQGGASDGGQDAATLAACGASVADQATCNSDPTCTKTCGLDISSLTTSRPKRTCTCSGSTASNGHWSCPAGAGSCVYPTDVDLSCFQLPTPVPACPHDPADGGTALIRSGVSSCVNGSSQVCDGVCGSATAGVFSYQNAGGAGQVGYCVCVNNIYQCALVNDWPAP